jgi:hypothetical protein
MCYKDFVKFFTSITFSYTRDDFHLTRICDQIEDERWGAARLVIPKDTDVAFLSLFQMN